MDFGQIVLLIFEIIIVLAALLILWMLRKGSGGSSDKKEIVRLTREIHSLEGQLQALQNSYSESQSVLRREMAENIRTMMNDRSRQASEQNEVFLKRQAESDKRQRETLRLMSGELQDRMSAMNSSVNDKLGQFEARLGSLEKVTGSRLENIRTTVDAKLGEISEANQQQLTRINESVNEKLQKTLESRISESFRQVNENLERVFKSVGEMQHIAQNVGDLKNILSNVKRRGILGEIQLGAILKEILAPEQYEENCAVVPKSKNRVEYAVKLPGTKDSGTVYLPIDSKFPGDRYEQLLAAYDTGDKTLIEEAKKELIRTIKAEARDIQTKYISPPDTTSFAILFLPFEGLYAEVINCGLVETLQKDYSVNIAGPSTMAAMLNALQMGFKTLAIQKRSSEVWQILGEAKAEFEKFGRELESAQENIGKVQANLERLVGTRTRQINKKLSSVEILPGRPA